ncbi:uncharacterized protein LOC104898995 [Beta vulgaris subsp. vulgaris]|uniref:uncharacterized protein LOC104898995 n=1 Tax=Beta vulgaris subsp. vulgaris TaxID=3555 RepID=UPI002036F601|nr:uncharacterized protein LOC104898995 [Beta vulgaris subsp. vulgaris]
MKLLQMQSPSSVEFEFNSGQTTPCGSSPSTPKGFGEYYVSAPTTPLRVTQIYRETEHFSLLRDESSTSHIPYNSSFGEELYNDCTIFPLKSLLSSPQSPKSQHKKSFWSVFSPKRKKDSNKYATTVVDKKESTRKQGRERERTRSLSPFRESQYPWEEEDEQKWASNTKEISSTANPSSPALSLSASSKGSKKWRLKDLLLFRSASEGRAFDNDPLKKYSYHHRKHEVAKNSTGSQSTQGSSIIPVRRERKSAHELHYTINKAISEDFKKKSFLPYKQGILGRLAFNPTVHTLGHGFGSLAHSHG